MAVTESSTVEDYYATPEALAIARVLKAEQALADARGVVALLREAGCPAALRRARSLVKSIEGAVRHAELRWHATRVGPRRVES